MSQPAEAAALQPEGRPSRTVVSVTVAICTAHRPAQALRAVRSLAGQTDPAEEILVVDNDPGSEAAWDTIRSAARSVRVLHEPTPGLNFARNRALREGSGDVLLFLDDDAVAAPDCVGAIRAVFAADARVGVCTGRVEALTLETEGSRLFEANGGFSRGLTRVELPRDAALPLRGRRVPLIVWAVSVGSGNNFAVRRERALALGGFDEALDMGAYLPAGGDHDMLWRVLADGGRVVYEPAALAWHEHRAEAHAVHEQIMGHQRGLMAMLCKAAWAARGHERMELLAFIVWRLFKPLVRLGRRLAGGRDPLPVIVLLRMWAHCWRGLFAYPLARRQARMRHGLAD